MTALFDGDVRQRLLNDLETSFVVEAAAGTGKTTVLVGRLVAMVRTGHARLRSMIAVTFTEKAAGEMKLRLRDALEKARRESTGTEHEHLSAALEELEIARIGTIHGLCADFLREYPVEARVDPEFEVAAADDSASLLEVAFGKWFERTVTSPPEGVRRFLRRQPKSSFESTPRQQLRDAAAELIEHRDFDHPWALAPFDRPAMIDEVITSLRHFAALEPLAAERRQWAVDHQNEVRRFIEDIDHREAIAPRDYDGLEASLRELNRLRNWDASFFKQPFVGVTTDEAVRRREACRSVLTHFVQRSEAELAGLLQHELWPVVSAYEHEKARSGRLDFVDLLLRTRDLIQQNPAVRRDLMSRFSHIFVDEFQDTDPLQAEIVLLLASADATTTDPFQVTLRPGALFVVGDPKQSIYRFRRADIQLYERVKQFVLSRGGELLYLSSSFRSTPAIQAAINGSFETAMQGQHQATYVPLQPFRPRHDGQPSLIALGVPKPFNEKGTRVTHTAVEACVPNTVGAFIEFLIRSSGWTVEVEGKRVPIQARHICLLFSRFRGWNGLDVPREYARALEARKLPHVLVGGRSFHGREEVLALRTVMSAIERPDDELSVYGALRGPFCAFTDEQLLVFRHQHGKLNPLRPWPHDGANANTASSAGRPTDDLASDDAKAIARMLTTLRILHYRRNRRSASDTLHAFLEEVRGFATVAFWNAGDQAFANVMHLLEVVRRLEARAGSFRELVELLHEEAESGSATETPLLEEGTEGVRMMTVHAAKGLEFPVVILAEPTHSSLRRVPTRFIDADQRLWVHPLAGCIPQQLRDHEQEVLERDREEALRVSYVAATRARDLLVVPLPADAALPDTWTSVLHPSLYPSPHSAHAVSRAPGCPEFTQDTVSDRNGPLPDGVPTPGLHLAHSGKNRVVWFDPNVLPLTPQRSSGLQQHEALDGADLFRVQESLERFTTWSTTRDRALTAGATTAFRIERPSDLPNAHTRTVTIEDTNVDRTNRPKGRRFGALVHAVMSTIPLTASLDDIRRHTKFHARGIFATPEECEGCHAAVVHALKHPLLVRAATLPPERVRREAQVAGMVDATTRIEGALDLAFDDGDTWRVIDFKTDEELEKQRSAYEAQVVAYVAVVAQATQKAAVGYLLRM